uniref:Uncharacterized protein n=1 Tax=Romanomermis culicivorax TaxID=13658 RepID=A0A915L018_ROMCU
MNSAGKLSIFTEQKRISILKLILFTALLEVTLEETIGCNVDPLVTVMVDVTGFFINKLG